MRQNHLYCRFTALLQQYEAVSFVCCIVGLQLYYSNMRPYHLETHCLPAIYLYPYNRDTVYNIGKPSGQSILVYCGRLVYHWRRLIFNIIFICLEQVVRAFYILLFQSVFMNKDVFNRHILWCISKQYAVKNPVYYWTLSIIQ